MNFTTKHFTQLTTDELYELFAMVSMKDGLKDKPIVVIDRIDFTCPDDDFAKAAATRACFAAESAQWDGQPSQRSASGCTPARKVLQMKRQRRF